VRDWSDPAADAGELERSRVRARALGATA